MVEPYIRKSSSILNPLSQSFQRALEKEKQTKVLKYQKDNYSTWRKQELKYIGKILLVHNFLESIHDNWKISNFNVKGEYDISCEIGAEWEKISPQTNPKGFDIANKIVKPSCKIRLNSIACDIKLKIRLVGDSSLFFISRNSFSIEAESPVVKVTRDTSLKGLFAMFGHVDPINKSYQYIKQVQIPEDTENQPLDKNYNELEITFCDNGDDRVYLSISSFGKYHSIKQFVTFCDSFVPYLEQSSILIGGSGEGVLLKSAFIQQRERNSNKVPERPQDCCCEVF